MLLSAGDSGRPVLAALEVRPHEQGLLLLLLACRHRRDTPQWLVEVRSPSCLRLCEPPARRLTPPASHGDRGHEGSSLCRLACPTGNALAPTVCSPAPLRASDPRGLSRPRPGLPGGNVVTRQDASSSRQPTGPAWSALILLWFGTPRLLLPPGSSVSELRPRAGGRACT